MGEQKPTYFKDRGRPKLEGNILPIKPGQNQDTILGTLVTALREGHDQIDLTSSYRALPLLEYTINSLKFFGIEEVGKRIKKRMKVTDRKTGEPKEVTIWVATISPIGAIKSHIKLPVREVICE